MMVSSRGGDEGPLFVSLALTMLVLVVLVSADDTAVEDEDGARTHNSE